MKAWANFAGGLVLLGILGYGVWRVLGQGGPPACDASAIVPVIRTAAEADPAVRQAGLAFEKLEDVKETGFDGKTGKRSCAGVLLFSGGVRWPGIWTLTKDPDEMRSVDIDIRLQSAPLAPAR
jgi:hypothetical protein